MGVFFQLSKKRRSKVSKCKSISRGNISSPSKLPFLFHFVALALKRVGYATLKRHPESGSIGGRSEHISLLIKSRAAGTKVLSSSPP